MFSFETDRREVPFGFTVLGLVSFSHTVLRLALPTLVGVMLFFSLSGCSKDDPDFRLAILLPNATYNPPISSGGTQDLILAGNLQSSAKTPKAPAGGALALASFTPTAAFFGNQVAILGGTGVSSTDPGAALLVRESNCSLTQYAVSYGVQGAYGSSSSIVATLPNVDAYLHQLAGLSGTAGTFPKGCSNRSLGTPSTSYVHLGRLSDGSSMAAYVDDSGKITVLKIGTSGAIVSQTVLASANAAHTLVAGDFNGDGIADLVTPLISANNTSGVGVYLSRADGSFGAVSVYGGYPANINRFYVRASIEDINGDGKLDIVAMGAPNAGNDLPTVVTLLGAGNGTFVAGSVAVKTMSLGAFVLADFNGDAHLDILSAGGYWLPGAGNGTFGAAAQRFANPVLVDGRTLAVGDFDGDGVLDAAVRSGRSAITIFKGLGNGTFSEASSYAGIRGADALSATDVNGDGILDLVVGLSAAGIFGASGDAQTIIQFLLGKGDGSFVAAQTLPGLGLSFSAGAPTLAIADFNADGLPDLVARSPLSNTSVILYRGSAQGSFSAAGSVATLSFLPRLFASGDLDGDGKPDVVAVGSSVAVMRGLGNSAFASALVFALPSVTGSIVNMALGDVNGDGRADVVLVLGGQSATSGGAFLYLANADGSLSAPTQIDNSTNIRSVTLGDVNGDGRADLVIGNFSTNFYVSPNLLRGVRIYRGNANGTFTAPLTLTPAGESFPALGIADMNKDGKADLVVSAFDAGLNDSVHVLPGLGDGSFGTPKTFVLPGGGPGINSLAVGDFTFDGNIDVMITGRYTEVLVGEGDGSVAAVSALVIAPDSTYAIAVNLNGDRTMDAVVVNADGVVPLLRVAAPRVSLGTGAPAAASNEFSTRLSASSASLASGGSVQTRISLSFGANFNQAVSFGCSGLPAYASCSFSPASLAPGAGASETVLTINTGVALATALQELDRGIGLNFGFAMVGGFGLAGFVGRFARVQRRNGVQRHSRMQRRGRMELRSRMPAILMMLFASVVLAGVVACGGGGGGGGGGAATSTGAVTPVGTYPITIVASGGGVTKSLVYTLTVQ